MKLVRSVQSPDFPKRGCVLAIGNFDAVHLGHQQIIRRLCEHGRRLELPTVVMTFDPSPQSYFVRDHPAPRLTDVSARYFALKRHGVDVMLLLPFNRRLAKTTAEEFVIEYLTTGLDVRHLIVGDDFRFGRGREGDFSLLKRMSTMFGYTVEDTQTLMVNGERVSSSRIRQLLAQGDLKAAEAMLGNRYAMVGRVTHGQQLGRQWGFPTLNLPVRHKPALTGVFAVEVSGIGDVPLKGAANLGKRPAVGGLKTLLEVHLFDFQQTIYGARVCVEFVERIRDEWDFHSLDALKAQIRKDVDRIREIFNAWRRG